jgi:hypothetical protein
LNQYAAVVVDVVAGVDGVGHLRVTKEVGVFLFPEGTVGDVKLPLEDGMPHRHHMWVAVLVDGTHAPHAVSGEKYVDCFHVEGVGHGATHFCIVASCMIAPDGTGRASSAGVAVEGAADC